jgi:hypothetical protein
MGQSELRASEGAREASHPTVRVETRRNPRLFRILIKSLQFLATVIEVAANLKTLLGD